MQPLKLIILSSVTFMQHSTLDNVAMFHVKHSWGGRAREPSGVDHGLRAGGPNNRHA